LGVKPIGKVQGNFKTYYLYGAVAPQTGASLIVGILTYLRIVYVFKSYGIDNAAITD
jgi:hypothetical protein